ncbi:MAG: NAD(P)-dependent oxidoreductase [Candidatus Cloacimonetes bacterium]|jgi:D-3-phosphoglycerate dehydrogenase|nr:NAD(P)-dependent oxidoreductase [Candidatus Cloacimonadota bacterium]
MKTLVLESMPDLFWEEIRKKSWNSYFTENKNFNDEIEIIIIRTTTDFKKDRFTEFPNLKMIIRAGSGFDNVDINEAQKRNVIVCNTPEANAISAYEQTLSFILALIKQHQICKNQVLKSNWEKKFMPNWEIDDLKVLIVGVGRVGTRIAHSLQYLGAQVKGVDPYLSISDWKQKNIESLTYKEGIDWCNLLTYHCPLTGETENYFNREILNILQTPLWLVNTSRGKVINESAVAQGLLNGKIIGFASDVFAEEPWKVKKFANNPNVILSPHVGAYTKKAKIRMSLETLDVWSNYVNKHQVSTEVDARFYSTSKE